MSPASLGLGTVVRKGPQVGQRDGSMATREGHVFSMRMGASWRRWAFQSLILQTLLSALCQAPRPSGVQQARALLGVTT